MTVYQRANEGPPVWNEVTKTWAAIEPPKEPRNARASGLRLPYVDRLILRADSALQAGQLLSFDSRWWEIESLANQDNRGAMLVCSGREFVGYSSTYTPLVGSPYSCLSYPTESNAWVSNDLSLNEPRKGMELFQPLLAWPWAKKGDQVAVRGVTHTIDAVEQGSDDGVVLRVICK